MFRYVRSTGRRAFRFRASFVMPAWQDTVVSFRGCRTWLPRSASCLTMAIRFAVRRRGLVGSSFARFTRALRALRPVGLIRRLTYSFVPLRAGNFVMRPLPSSLGTRPSYVVSPPTGVTLPLARELLALTSLVDATRCQRLSTGTYDGSRDVPELRNFRGTRVPRFARISAL